MSVTPREGERDAASVLRAARALSPVDASGATIVAETLTDAAAKVRVMRSALTPVVDAKLFLRSLTRAAPAAPLVS